MATLQGRLRWLFQTNSPVVVLTCSATGAHEAVARMLHPPASEAIVCVNGRFGGRWAAMLELFGVRVHRVQAAWGENIALEQLEGVLEAVPHARSLWVVHTETSTGVRVPLQQIAECARKHRPEIIVCADVVSSLGIEPLFMDQWGIDVAIASSQKGVGGLPGLAVVAISQRASAAFVQPAPTLYFDLHAALDAAMRNSTPFTPAVTVVVALNAALELIEQEGLQARWERYARDAAYLRARLQAAGYKLFGESSAHAVTVVRMPPELPTLVEQLKQRYGIIVARGQEQYHSQLVRIGHCGWYSQEDLAALADAFEELMPHR
jgi:aspartate aminotransferase-like enzyme